MALKDSVLEVLRLIAKDSQDELKSVLAEGISLVQNPKQGIGTELFESIFEVVPQVAVELLPVDNVENPTRVLLQRRPANVLTHPGRVAALGTYVRLGETDLDAVRRCVKRELGQQFDVSYLKFSHHYNRPKGCADEAFADGKERHTIGLIYLVKMTVHVNEDDSRKWTSSISSDLLKGHQDFVEQALGFKRTDTPLFD